MSLNSKVGKHTTDILNTVVLPEQNASVMHSFSFPTNINNDKDLNKYLAAHYNLNTDSKEYKKAVRKFNLNKLKITIKRIVCGIPGSIPLFIIPLIFILLLYVILRNFFPFIEEISLSHIIIISFILHNVCLEIRYRKFTLKGR